MNRPTCTECRYEYEKWSQAEYCAKTDLDPRQQNAQLRDGTLASRWIPKPIGRAS